MLSPRRINLLSSSKRQHKQCLQKQNQKIHSRSPDKITDNLYTIIIRLLQLIKENELKIPTQLLKHLPHNIIASLQLSQLSTDLSQTGIKSHLHVESESKQKKDIKQKQVGLQKRINDLMFQLKKNEQDSAEQILLIKLNHNKQVKKSKQKYTQLQIAYARQTNQLQTKIQQFKQYYDKIIQQLKQQTKQQITQATGQIQNKHKQQINNLHEKINTFQQHKQKQLQIVANKIEVQNQRKIAEIKKIIVIKEQEKQNKCEEYLQHQRKIQMQWENRRLNWQQQLKKQRKKYDEQIIGLCKQKQKLYTDLYLVRKDNTELKDQISHLKIQIKGHQLKIKNTGQQYIAIQKQHQKQLQMQQHKNYGNIRALQQSFQQKKQLICLQHIKKLSKNDYKLRQLQTLYQTHVALSMAKLEQSEKQFDRREPRRQDTQKIQKFEMMVNRKQLQIRELRENCQRTKMQTQNNQKNYNRIFSASKRASSANYTQQTHRETGSGIQRIYKQGHTVDMNLILKACNKNF